MKLSCDLTKLNLYGNNITDIKLFEYLSVFENLKILYVGKNKFSLDNIYNIDYKAHNIINCHLAKIKEIDLTKGAFSQTMINLLPLFNFKNLEIIFLNENHLSSLLFVENLECPNLSEIWLNNNSIKEFMLLIKFRNLKRIELERNNIENIDNLDHFVSELKYLEKLNLKGNKIDSNDKRIIKSLDALRKEFAKMQLLVA